MSSDEPDGSGMRLPQIDALRGLAALTVILYHFVLMFQSGFLHFDQNGQIVRDWSYAILTGLRPLYSGEEAVILFFILSGFVLSLPSLSGRGQPYPVFVCRRIFRIYVPYLAALALAVLGNSIWHGSLGRGTWADATWLNPVDWKLVVQHILFVGEYPAATFNTAFWSLVVEMRASLVFPLLFLLTMRVRRRVGLFFLLCMACAFIVVVVEHLGHHRLINSEFTFRFIGMFLIGIVIASYRDKIRHRVSALNNSGAIALLLVSIAVYAYSWFVIERYVKATFAIWISAAGAVGILCLGIGWTPMTNFLLTKIPQFLGKISYSLYLVHGTVLFALTYTCGAKCSPFVIFAIYAPLTILSAWVMYRYIEKPAMEYGRVISRKLGRRPEQPVLART
jgi:peptidoglycan/LPS O-acetylase OafA/YrhL